MMNETFNSTKISFGIYYEGLSAVAAFVCILVFLLGLIGNSLVLIVFGSRFSRLKSFEIYLISLAAADLIASVLIPSKMLYEIVGGTFYHGGVFGCIVIQSVCTGTIVVSCLTLVVISLNRYIVVKWPLRERRSNLMLFCVIMGTWLTGFILGFCLYGVKGRVIMVPANGVVLCSLNMTNTELRWYGATLFISQSGIPLLSMSILYGLIIYELKKTANLNFFQNRQHMLNNIYQRNKKSIRLLIALLVVFLICTTPEKVSYVIYTFRIQSMDPDQWHLTYIILTLILMVNHCINPIIYAKLHTSFRRHTLRLFCSCKLFKLKNIRDGLQSVITRNHNESFLTVNYSVDSKLNETSAKRDSVGSVSTIVGKRKMSVPSQCETSVIDSSCHKRLDPLLEHDDNHHVETNV